jgi:hypothetical protein
VVSGVLQRWMPPSCANESINGTVRAADGTSSKAGKAGQGRARQSLVHEAQKLGVCQLLDCFGTDETQTRPIEPSRTLRPTRVSAPRRFPGGPRHVAPLGSCKGRAIAPSRKRHDPICVWARRFGRVDGGRRRVVLVSPHNP